MMFVSLAGPFSNIVLAVFCGFFVRVISPSDHALLFYLFSFGVYINVALALFNMIPIFPLDGSSILKGLVSVEMAEKISHLDRMGAFIMLGIFLVDHFLHIGILWYVLGFPIMTVVEILTQESFPLLQQVFIASFG